MSSSSTNGTTTRERKKAPSPGEVAAETAPPAYYETARKDFWIENDRGGWITINETGLKRYLKNAGVGSIRADGAPLCPMDQKILSIQREKDVAFAGALAGYRSGIVEILGHRILVTSSPKLIEPKEGPFPVISALLENLFNDTDHGDQRPYVLGWLKIAFEALRARARRPGQALVIAGERDSGKSLFQNLITEILGGRSVKPYRYMSGETPFNSELCGAEHLMIEDDVASTDIRKRLHFGARIKEATVNEVQSLHAKRVPAISVKLFWRVSVTLNDEAEHLLILPPIDHSLADKIILLRARKRPMPMPTESQAERDSFWAAMLAELPAFTWFLTKWEIPKALRCARFGVTHYHHPVLLQAVEDLTPQTRLLELIDMHFWPTENPEDKIKVTRTPSLEITAVELEGMLLGGNMSREAHGVLTWPGAVGTYLGRLAGKYPKRIQSARGALRKWLIMPPGGGGR